MASCLLAGLSLSLNVGAAEIVPPSPPAVHVAPGVRMVLLTGSTVTNEQIRYPSGAQARVTAVEITLEPGQQTGWHTHPVPLFAYILEGELTVDYGAKGERTYRKGDGLVEAIDETHNGRNTGQNAVKILGVFIGMEGMPGTAPASPPAR
jgi:quercetin dioxygenase-like cupin family protein